MIFIVKIKRVKEINLCFQSYFKETFQLLFFIILETVQKSCLILKGLTVITRYAMKEIVFLIYELHILL